jgi:hypothetical protein
MIVYDANTDLGGVDLGRLGGRFFQGVHVLSEFGVGDLARRRGWPLGLGDGIRVGCN